MERNERLKAADKCASKYNNENEARIARRAFMLGCEFEAQGEMVKGVVLEIEEEHWKPSDEQMNEQQPASGADASSATASSMKRNCHAGSQALPV